MNNKDLLNMQNNLARHLKGFSCDYKQLKKDFQQFQFCNYEGYMFRGFSFSHVMTKDDIKEELLCSWSTDINVALQFASNGRYSLVAVRKGTGMSIEKLLSHWTEHNQLLSEELKQCKAKYEHEILAPLDRNCIFFEPI